MTSGSQANGIRRPGYASPTARTVRPYGRSGRLHPFVKTAAVSTAGLVVFFAVWELIALQLPSSRLVTPVTTADDLVRNFLFAPRLQVFGLGRVGYASLLLYTLRNTVLGLAAGGVVGILVGIASARLSLLRIFVDPVVLVLGTVPVLVAAPLFLLWFGVVPFTQVLLVAMYSAVMLTLFSQRAVENLDPTYERWAMTFGAGLGMRMRNVLIPGTVPEILGGIRITLASAWGLETFAEILGAPSGIGQAIKALTNMNNVSGLLACVVLVASVAILTDLLLLAAVGRITRWA